MMENGEVDIRFMLQYVAVTIGMAMDLAAKDADLPRDDVLGEIDRGTVESLMSMAQVQAADVMRCSREGRFVNDHARWMPLRRLSALLASDQFEFVHERWALMQRVTEQAIIVAAEGNDPDLVQRFDDTYRMAARVFSKGRVAGRDDEEGGPSLG